MLLLAQAAVLVAALAALVPWERPQAQQVDCRLTPTSAAQRPQSQITGAAAALVALLHQLVMPNMVARRAETLPAQSARLWQAAAPYTLLEAAVVVADSHLPMWAQHQAGAVQL